MPVYGVPFVRAVSVTVDALHGFSPKKRTTAYQFCQVGIDFLQNRQGTTLAGTHLAVTQWRKWPDIFGLLLGDEAIKIPSGPILS